VSLGFVLSQSAVAEVVVVRVVQVDHQAVQAEIPLSVLSLQLVVVEEAHQVLTAVVVKQ
jgi:hypothetical protein